MKFGKYVTVDVPWIDLSGVFYYLAAYHYVIYERYL